MIVDHLQTRGEEIVTLTYRHLVFSIEGPRPVGIGEAVPLIMIDTLYPVVAGEDACQGRVA